MSGIIGALTSGRIALAIGTVTAGAVIGGAVAEHRDGDVARGALVGGASALAGIALLWGGHAAWSHLRSGRAAAAAGATQLGSTLAHVVAAPAPTVTAAAAAATAHTVAPSASAGFRNAVARMFQEASTVAATHSTRVTVPAFAATPSLPAAGSGATFLSTMTRFLA